MSNSNLVTLRDLRYLNLNTFDDSVIDARDKIGADANRLQAEGISESISEALL